LILEFKHFLKEIFWGLNPRSMFASPQALKMMNAFLLVNDEKSAVNPIFARELPQDLFNQ